MQQEIRHGLEQARIRTREIISTVDDPDLYRQHNPLMSPIAWDLGHIGNFEELWGIRSLPGSNELFPALDRMYDAVLNPRSTRSSLPLPSRSELFEYLDAIRSGLLEAAVAHEGSDHPLGKDDFVYHMLHQHELQHQETILQTLQLKLGNPYAPGFPLRPLPDGDSSLAGTWVDLPGGAFVMGTDRLSGVYDNERPSRVVTLEPFRLGTVPVTNGEYRTFIEDGGYAGRELWDDAGWEFIREHDISAPMYWEKVDGVWTERVLNRTAELDPDRPVCHICWYEAAAYARYVGGRLPTEAEWEYAACHDPESGRSTLFPWGDDDWIPSLANLDMSGAGRAPVGAYPNGVSRLGLHQMIGDVWEWTSSCFEGYPGFEAFPYDEYSRIFFGSEYRVLRGGSWVTPPGAIRGTFRNWDFPIRRQIFAGVRIATTP